MLPRRTKWATIGGLAGNAQRDQQNDRRMRGREGESYMISLKSIPSASCLCKSAGSCVVYMYKYIHAQICTPVCIYIYTYVIIITPIIVINIIMSIYEYVLICTCILLCVDELYIYTYNTYIYIYVYKHVDISQPLRCRPSWPTVLASVFPWHYATNQTLLPVTALFRVTCFLETCPANIPPS